MPHGNEQAVGGIKEEETISVEDDVNVPYYEIDSAFSDDGQTALSKSIQSSIYSYRYENGRTYHAYRDGQYLIPNDDEEQDRLDLAHHLFKMILGGALYTAPLSKKPHRILDIGTGTGIWAIEMADQFPMASVIGTDLSPIQPTWVPPNLQFYIDDAESDWMFQDSEKFDFIHARALSGGIADWPKFYAQAYENLQPGGWIEMQDNEAHVTSDDGGLDRAPSCRESMREVDRACQIIGKLLNVAHLHRQWMIDAGFEEVTESIRKVPIGPWAKDPRMKEIGAIMRLQMLMCVPAFTLAYYTRVLGYSVEKTEVTMAMVKQEFQDKSLHLYLRWHFVTGRKPGCT